MFSLTNEERRQLARGDANISKELQRKREFINIIKEETKLRQYFDELLLSSYDDDAEEKDEQSSRVTQRMEQALSERRRYFSTNPLTMTRTLSLPSIFSSTFTPRKIPQNNSNLAALLNRINNNNVPNAISSDKFPSLGKQTWQSENTCEGLPKDYRFLAITDRPRKSKADDIVERRGRTLSYPVPIRSMTSSQGSVRDAWKGPSVERWKIKLHKRRYALFS